MKHKIDLTGNFTLEELVGARVTIGRFKCKIVEDPWYPGDVELVIINGWVLGFISYLILGVLVWLNLYLG